MIWYDFLFLVSIASNMQQLGGLVVHIVSNFENGKWCYRNFLSCMFWKIHFFCLVTGAICATKVSAHLTWERALDSALPH
jgi:hypothetical protein